MSEAVVTAPGKAPSMGLFERYLTLWVALCIVAGIAFGQLAPGVFHALGAATVAQVNLPVAILVWLMVVPMLLKIDLGALSHVRGHWRGIAATVAMLSRSLTMLIRRKPNRSTAALPSAIAMIVGTTEAAATTPVRETEPVVSSTNQGIAIAVMLLPKTERT